MLTAFLLALSVAGAPARADEAEAESCLRAKIWDGYSDGWAVRTATTATLGQGEYRIYLVTLYGGSEYRIRACGDAAAGNVDIVLHDADGKPVAHDDTADRQPELVFEPQATATYYVAVHLTAAAEEGARAGVGMAVTYR